MTDKTAFVLVVLVAACVGGAASSSYAQSNPAPGAFSAGFFAGIARPSDEAFRQIYGSLQFPISLQADVRIYGNLHAFSGYEFVTRRGRVLMEGNGSADAGNPLKFRMHTVKAGGLYAVPVRNWTLLAGAGVGFHRYLERWEAAGVSTSGNKAGLIVQAGAQYAMRRRFALAGKVEYSNIPIQAVSEGEIDANLGRLEFALGLVFRVK
jgi:opacity protein-like surface antigen